MILTPISYDCSILIVDDQCTSRTILSQIVKSICPKAKITEVTNPEKALEWATEHTADLVLVDYVMPEMNGVDFVSLLKKIPAYDSVPVIMITIKKDSKTRYDALDAGVADFLSKPVDVYECSARCKNLLTMRQQHLALENKSNTYENLVITATAEIRAREKETLMRLARAGEHKDYDTSLHLQRMALYSKAIAQEIGFSKEEAEIIELAAPLHDIGKIGIPDSILLKRAALSTFEQKIMQNHPLIGYEILQDSPSKYLQKGSEIALAHHEKFDGSGYPYSLSGNEIPLSARIVAVADVLDALTSNRPYKEAWSLDKALEFINHESGKHFDPDLVSALLSMRVSLEKIYNEHATSAH
jgi:two-component system, response regulator RpfG